MTRVFFSHASEDKPAVLQVQARLQAAYPDLGIWIDRYEIAAGNDLVEAIGKGMDEADVFFVFISPASITKPWVKAELHDAITQEITGSKPGWIVPVVLSRPDSFPAFIRAKKYIAVGDLPEREWLAEFEHAITGARTEDRPDLEDNTVIESYVLDPRRMALIMKPRYWAQPVDFTIDTTVPVVDIAWEYNPPQAASFGVSAQVGGLRSTFAIQSPTIAAKTSFSLLLTFGQDVDASALVGCGPTPSRY